MVIPTVNNNSNNQYESQTYNNNSSIDSLLKDKIQQQQQQQHYKEYFNNKQLKILNENEMQNFYNEHYDPPQALQISRYNSSNSSNINHVYYTGNNNNRNNIDSEDVIITDSEDNTDTDSSINSNNNNNNYHNQNHRDNFFPTIIKNGNSFIPPKRISEKRDLFKINNDTTRGFSNSKTQIYNKNYKNKRDYLKNNSSKKYNNNKYYNKSNRGTRINRIQKKKFSLIIRNKYGITHDTIINNILKIFSEYSICYIIVSFEGKNPLNENNTNTPPNDNPMNNTNTLMDNPINNPINNNNTNNLTNTPIDQEINITSTDDSSPHYHVLFKTKKIVDISNRIFFDNISINHDNKIGTCFIVKNDDLNKINSISYIVKEGNVKTWGEVPTPKEPKIKVTDDIALKITEKDYSTMDIISERPGFALINLKKIKEFKAEVDYMKSIKNHKSWDMMLINISKFNNKELDIFDWMINNLPVTLTTNERPMRSLSQLQIYIYGGVGSGKTSLSKALRDRLPTYDFNENDHHNLYNDDIIHLVIKDEFKGGSIPISKINQFLDGQEFTLNTKGGVTMKKRNQPCIFLSNFHILKIYEKAINDNPMIKAQLTKRFHFVDLGTYEYGFNTMNEEDDRKSIDKLFNLINSINNDIDKEVYEESEESFKSVYGKYLLEYLWENKKISEYMLCKAIRIKYEKLKKVDKNLPDHDINLLKTINEGHCKEFLEYIELKNGLYRKSIDDNNMEIGDSNNESVNNNFINNNNSNKGANDYENNTTLNTDNSINTENIHHSTDSNKNSNNNIFFIDNNTFVPGLNNINSNSLNKNNNSTTMNNHVPPIQIDDDLFNY